MQEVLDLKKKKKKKTNKQKNAGIIISIQTPSNYSFGKDYFCQLILLFSLFLLLFMGLLHFLVLLMGSTILFQLIFIFIYSTLRKKFSVSVK